MADDQAISKAPPLSVEEVIKTVAGVNWRRLGKGLIGEVETRFVPIDADPYTNLDEIHYEYYSDEDRLRAVVEEFLNGPGSWRTVIWALFCANEIDKAQQIRNYAEPLEDPTLTVESLVGVMEKVTSDEGRRRKVWERVLWWNDVTPHYDVYSKYMYATAQKETHALADVYVNIRPESSWQHLVQILYIKGEMAALMEAKPFLQQEDDPTLTVENLIGVMEKVTLDEDRRRMVWFFVLEMDHQVPFSFDEIYIKYTTAKEKTHALADIYVNIRPESSWQHLLQTLYDRNELEAAKEAKAFLQQNRDPTLTVERLVGVMEKVTSDERRSEVWKEVLRWDPYSVPNEIYTKYTTAKEKAQALADIYVNSRPESSWQYLAKILYAEGELAAAKEAKAFLQQSDPTLTVENVTDVMENITDEIKRRQVWKTVLGDIKYYYSFNETHACSEVYVNCHPESSWEHLTSLLYEIDEMSVVDQARTFLPPTDLTLTIERLTELFQSVEDPDDDIGIDIGEFELGLPKSALEEIRRSYHSRAKRKEAYLDTYANHHPCPSWKRINEILQQYSLYQQAEEVKNTYVKVAEKTRYNFEIAMKGGTLMIRNGSVFFLGPGGSGKTHTLHAFLQENPPSIRQSTPCTKRAVRTIAQCKVGVEGVYFIRIQDDQYSDMLSTTAKLIQPRKLATTFSPTQSRQHGEIPQVISASSQVSSNEYTEETESHTTKQEDSDFIPEKKKESPQSHRSGFERELLRRMQMVPKRSEDLIDKDLIDMKDSGGQPMFHEVLPLFVKNTTFGVLTVKLNERLDSYPMVDYYSNGKPVGEPFPSPYTHLQTFRHCMRVLQSTCSRDTCPKLVFIGTHKDCEQEYLDENRKEKNRKLQEIIPPDLKQSVLYYKHSNEELLFGVNVKTPEDIDRKMIGYVRQKMIIELQKLPQQRIPLQYFALENAFIRLAKYQHKAILSKSECFREAAAYHFTKESFEAALKYLHGLKLIFHYEEVLPEVVFIDAQTILDKITELVEFSLSMQSKPVHELSVSMDIKEFQEFKAYGIVTLDLLSQFNSHYVPGLFMQQQLVVVLKYQRVIAEVGEGKYIVPCLLRVHVPRPLPHSDSSSITATLLFYFGPNGPKLGVYCCLLASLITEAKWELMTENNRPVQVSRNQVQFRLPGDDPGAITITDSFTTFFRVSIDFPDDMDIAKAEQIREKICPSIRETILSTIQKTSHKLNYNNSIPAIAFPCTKHLPSDLHPATVSSSGLLTCTLHPASVCSDLTEQHQIWLGRDTKGTTTQSHSDQEVASIHAPSCFSVLDGTPTLAKLSVLRAARGKRIRIIKRLAPNWRDLGILLDFDEAGSQLDIIDSRHRGDPEACCQAMFQHWVKGNGVKPCSWSTLIELLDDCGQQALAKEVQEALQ